MHYLRSSHGKIEAADIEALDLKFAVGFPHDYKQFLLRNNGGFSSSTDERFEDALFYHIGPGPSSLKEEIYEREDDRFIPIGLSSNEDPIVLDSTGAVYLDGERIANSFASFVRHYLIPLAEQ